MFHYFRTHRLILHREIFLLSMDQVKRGAISEETGGNRMARREEGLVFSSPEKRTKPIAPGRVSGTGDRKVSNPDFHSLVTLTRVDRATLCTRLLKFPGGDVLAAEGISRRRGDEESSIRRKITESSCV